MTCNSLTSCKSCSGGYILMNESCLESCPFTTFAFTDSSQNTSECRSCQTGCLECENSSFCLSCGTSKFLVDGKCLDICPVATYSSGNTCLPCEEGCL